MIIRGVYRLKDLNTYALLFLSCRVLSVLEICRKFALASCVFRIQTRLGELRPDSTGERDVRRRQRQRIEEMEEGLLVDPWTSSQPY